MITIHYEYLGGSPREFEVRMSARVQRAKAEVLALLPPELRETRAHHGSENPTTFEDHARELVKRSYSARAVAAWAPRIRQLEGALSEFQLYVGLLWGYTVDPSIDIAGRLTRVWWSRSRVNPAYTFDVAFSDAVWAIRQALLTYEGDVGARLETYLRQPVWRALWHGNGQAGAPFQRPRDAARQGALAADTVEDWDALAEDHELAISAETSLAYGRALREDG